MLTNVNLTWIPYFLIAASSYYEKGGSVNKILKLGGKVTPNDFSDAERYLTFY